jgi:hypothetical protein
MPKSYLTSISILSLLAFGCSSSNATPPDAGMDAVDAPLETRADVPSESAGDAGDAPDVVDSGSVDGDSMDVLRDADVDAPLVNATITTLTPSSAVLGTVGAMLTLIVDGRDFTPTAMVSFGNNIFPTTVLSTTRLQAEIPSAALGATAKQVAVRVTRVESPSLTSNILYFTVLVSDAAGTD